MFTGFGRKALSVLCALLLAVSVTVSTLIADVSASETVAQSFENIPALKNVKYFSIYEAVDAEDANVKDGAKSLKWTAGSGTDAVSFWQSGMDLTVGQKYKLEMYIKLSSANCATMVLKQLTARDNGWAASGAEFSINSSGFTAGQWEKYEIIFTAEQRAVGMWISGTGDVYFDHLTFTPVTAESVTVTVNPNNGETVEPLTGTPGDAMTLPTLTRDGMDFGGWYTDETLTAPLSNTTTFPLSDIAIYAKWLPAGTVIQDFEADYSASSDNGFRLYTATDANDTNVHGGSKSLKWTAMSGSKAGTLWSTGKDLEIGKTYKLELWLKMETATRCEIKLVQLNVKTNGWSYGSNTQYSLGYIGNTYQEVGQWKKYELTIEAQTTAMGLLVYGDDNFYIDDVSWTPVGDPVTVTVEPGNGQTVEPLVGVTGTDMILPTLTKDGCYFAGWFLNAEFTEAFTTGKFPAENITLYARWIQNGLITQNFESYDHTPTTDSGFVLYTAADSNDANVYEGAHSLYRTNINKTRVAALSDPYISMTPGKAYKATFQLKVTDLGTGGGLQLTNLNDRTNPWSYVSLNDNDLGYIGSTYQYVDEWVERSIVFIAKAPYFGFSSWGNISYYLDDFKIVEVPIVTVTFDTGDGEAIAPMTGAAGMSMTVDNPTPPEGKTFGGWYSDPNFTEPYKIAVFPDQDITIYARWITEGTYEQDFEVWPSEKGAYYTSDVFTLYTAQKENDPNVYSGKHSMYYSNEDNQNTFALNIFDETMGKLVVGEKYYVTIHFKPDKTPQEKWATNTTYHSIYYTTQQGNCWSWSSQGPIGRYNASVFYQNSIDDSQWVGTTNAVTTTTEKDENGWLTMTYEITAQTPYIALYMTGYYSMYIDAITITTLPSGLVAEDYSRPYAEDFYNILDKNGLTNTPNGTEKRIYKLELDPRGDYIFTASLMKGVNGNSKVYLTWDSQGQDVIEGTVFAGNGTDYKLQSSRVMTDFTGIVYLVVEGGGAGACDYFALFPTRYAHEENPNPDFVYQTVDENALPTKAAALKVTGSGTDSGSPATGEASLLFPLALVCLTAAAAILFRKRGIDNAE